MCQVQQQVLGTWYEADRAGHLDYVDHGLGENHLCSGLLTHMWLGGRKKVKLTGQGSKERKVSDSRRGKREGRGIRAKAVF